MQKPVSSQLAKRSFALPKVQIEVKYLNCEHQKFFNKISTFAILLNRNVLSFIMLPVYEFCVTIYQKFSFNVMEKFQKFRKIL